MLLALGAQEPRAPRSPVKTSDFESPGDGTRQKNVTDRSTQSARHTFLLEDSATARPLFADSELACLRKGDQARRLVSILPNQHRRGVRQRSLGCAIGWFGGPIWRDS